MGEPTARTRTITIPNDLRAGVAAIDTRDLADLLREANPWMGGAGSIWFQMAAGLKDCLAEAPGTSNPANPLSRTTGKIEPRGVVPDQSTPAVNGLAEAWAEAEAALPEGWEIKELSSRWGSAAEPWRVEASRFVDDRATGRGSLETARGSGPTPAAALRALAARLRDPS